jgi:predicted lipoprotein with Yx(FWY)xxD motif
MNKNNTTWAIVVIVIVIIIALVVWNRDMSQGSTPTATTPSSSSQNTSASQSDQSAVAPSGVQATSPTPTPTQAIVLNTVTSIKLGTYLVATNGMTLYEYGRDLGGVSNCTGACATAWPPYTTTAISLEGGSSVKGTISVITRVDGSKQITYGGMPLYFWSGDSVPSDTTGQGVGGFTVVKP